MEMKAGDLVVLSPYLYSKYEGKLGVLIRRRHINAGQWEVAIDGHIHPYFVCIEDLEVVNASR